MAPYDGATCPSDPRHPRRRRASGPAPSSSTCPSRHGRVAGRTPSARSDATPDDLTGRSRSGAGTPTSSTSVRLVGATTSSCGGSTTGRLLRDARRLQHRRSRRRRRCGAGARWSRRHHRHPRRPRRAGPVGTGACWSPWLPRRPRSPGSGSPLPFAVTLGSPAPATPARTASEFQVTGAPDVWIRVVRRRRTIPASSSAPRTRCASRPVCRSTATSCEYDVAPLQARLG